MYKHIIHKIQTYFHTKIHKIQPHFHAQIHKVQKYNHTQTHKIQTHTVFIHKHLKHTNPFMHKHTKVQVSNRTCIFKANSYTVAELLYWVTVYYARGVNEVCSL